MRRYLILLLGLGDCHHLDEVADGVLAVDRGAAPPLEPPLHRAAVYHCKKGRRKLRDAVYSRIFMRWELVDPHIHFSRDMDIDPAELAF